MIGVKQTILTKEEGGNCFAACLASILEVPLEAVPNPALEWRKDDERATERGWEVVQQFLAGLGMTILAYGDEEELAGWRPPGFWIAGVPSPRLEGETHAVVYEGGTPVWDPHPSVSELDPSAPILFCDALLVTDPCRLARELALISAPVLETLRLYVKPALFA